VVHATGEGSIGDGEGGRHPQRVEEDGCSATRVTAQPRLLLEAGWPGFVKLVHEHLKSTGCHMAQALLWYLGKHITDDLWGTEEALLL
jgi:hypothetical protein